MKKIRHCLVLLGMLSATSAAAQVKEFNKPTDQYFEISKNLEIFSNIFKELNANYVDPIDPGQMTKTAIDMMLYQLDPYTTYMTETDKEDYEFQTLGKYGGIGASIEIIDSLIYIGEVFENSPVHKAGIQAGDQLISIDEVKVTGKKIDEISLLLRGAPGTNIKLEVKSPMDPTVVLKNIKRENIEIKSVPFYALIGDKKDVAYVYLSQFTHNCAQDVLNALEDLKKQQANLKGVVLDLRGNPGGLLNEAVKICNLFLPKGQHVVSMKGKNTSLNKDFKTENDPWDLNIPLTILINSSSASASEVVAGTIQDLDRGVVIGVKSFGKGLVQNVKPLGYNTALKVTTAKYYTPSGRCIQAVDYSSRNPDGSVATVPDSLKKAFKTKIGRVVYDGGGIEPDISTKNRVVNRAMISLFQDGHIFTFATDYFYKHKTIVEPEKFSITDAEYNQFLKFIEQRNFSFESETEALLKELETTMKNEQYYEDHSAAINALKDKIAASKKSILEQHKDFLKLVISNDIVGRYYFQKGKVVHRLHHDDEELTKALHILDNLQTEYTPIISGKK